MSHTNNQFTRTKEKIISYICENDLSGGDKLPSVRRFAKDLKVSPLTVQKAVGSLISQGILTAKVGSGTYIAAPRRNQNTNRIIGVLMPPFQPAKSVFQGEIFRGIESFLQKHNYRALLMQRYSGDIEKEEFSVINDMLRQEVRGIVANLISPHDCDLWTKLENENIPIVCVNNLGPKHLFGGVSTNNFVGGMLAAECLYKNGHRNIALAATDLNSKSVIDRIQGFKNYLAKKSLEIQPENIFSIPYGDVPKNQIDTWADKMTSQKKRPTAVFAINDDIAVELLIQFERNGTKVPNDISLIGFDDNEICRFVNPQLTTVRQPAFEMGLRAAEIMLKEIEMADTSELMEISLKPELIERNSVKKIS